MEELALWFVIAIALAFDFVNGFHDAANSIATVVSTRVLSPKYAVIWAAAFNFIAFLVFGTKVASTIANDVVNQDVLSIGVIFAGLIGAISWSLFTFYLGLPDVELAHAHRRDGRRGRGQGRLQRARSGAASRSSRCSS